MDDVRPNETLSDSVRITDTVIGRNPSWISVAGFARISSATLSR
jgi:hypothetical protein